jgi:hypothetical protein
MQNGLSKWSNTFIGKGGEMSDAKDCLVGAYRIPDGTHCDDCDFLVHVNGGAFCWLIGEVLKFDEEKKSYAKNAICSLAYADGRTLLLMDVDRKKRDANEIF